MAKWSRFYGGEESLGRLEVLDNTIDEINKKNINNDIPQSVIDEAAKRACWHVRRFIIRMILSKKRALGIKNISGNLERAIMSLEVTPSDRGSFTISLKTSPDLYKAYASINYGSVRTNRSTRNILDLPTMKAKTSVGKISPIGAKAKQTIKKIAEGKPVSKKAILAVQRGYNARGYQVTSGMSTAITERNKSSVKIGGGASEIGGSTVIKEKPFWTLTQSERKEIQDYYVNKFLEYISELI